MTPLSLIVPHVCAGSASVTTSIGSSSTATATRTPSVSPTISVSSSSGVCPVEWILYRDDGTEGHDSCIFLARELTIQAHATTLCQSYDPAAHLITFAGANTSTGLYPFTIGTYRLFSPPVLTEVWVGCQQSPAATNRGQNWTWVDGTPAANINCGNGADGCGLWRYNAPRDDGSGVEMHARDFCQLFYAALADADGFGYDRFTGDTGRSALCELDLYPGMRS